jgi:SRSO17 transposase
VTDDKIIREHRAKGATLLKGMAQRFTAFCRRFSHHFRSRTRNCSTAAKHYLSGLLQARKKNMERMEEVVLDSDEQVLHHFCANSPWDARQVQRQVAAQADEILGGHENSCLLIDESGFVKKGKKSVGVSRQWNGRLGKVDNCQVAVFTALAKDDQVTPVDVRLYLPEEWTTDPDRCLAAGVPREQIVFKKKVALALEMIHEQRQAGLRFQWIGADGLYGHDPEFTQTLDDAGEIFLVDVHKDQRIYLEAPEPLVPEVESKSGCQSGKLKARTESFRVDKWTAMQPDHSWSLATLRDSTKGKLRVEILHRRIWVWDGKEKAARQWHLVVRRDAHSKSDYKYSLSNAPADTSSHRLAYMQGQRYWVERMFEDGKSETGMADYQTRGWLGWHHHMALVMMTMLFMLEERCLHRETHPLLSCSDVETLLAHFLPRRDITVDEVLRQMEVRHRKRQASIDSAYRIQMRSTKGYFP